MAVRHSLYGLRLASNFPIPGLRFRDDLFDADVEIRLRVESGPAASVFSLPIQFSYVSSNLCANGQSVLRAGRLGDGFFGFFYSDGPRFAVKREGREVWADGPENYVLEDLATYLVGPVMGFVLRLNGILPLHAC